MARFTIGFSLFLSLLTIVFLIPSAYAQQQDPATTQGLKPYGSYHGGDIDVVSVENGKPDVHAPLISYPQRGALTMNFTIRYWNPSYEVDKDCEPGNPPPPCQYITSASVVGVYVSPDFLQVGTSAQGYTDANGKVIGNVYSVTTPDGGSHPLGATSATVFESVDATGFRWDKSANVITDKDGIRYSVAPNGTVQDNSAEDTNGNRITLVSGGYQDTLGRLIPSVPSIFGASGGTIGRCPTGALSVFEAFDWNAPGPNGTSGTYTFCYIHKPLNVNLHVGAHSLADTHSPTMLQSIVLPNGQFWNFTYGDQYGNLTQITLPTGGTISYTPAIAQMCFIGGAFPQTYFSSVGTRSINANDGNGTANWTYTGSIATQGGNTTIPLTRTVTDPLGNQDVYTMTPLDNTCSYFETEVQKYQGSSSSGALLETTNTAYSYTLNVNDNSARKSVVNVVPTTETTTWPNGKTKRTFYSYDGGFAYSGPGGNSTGIYGNRLSQFDYDYGVGSAGPILRETYTNYLAFSNSTYLNLNLLNLVSSQKVTDANAVQKAYTTYSYDQSALSPSGVTMQHDSAPPTGSTRGNQTSVSRWLNTTGSYLTTNRVFYDTGMLSTSTDPLLHTTTYDYSSSFYGSYVTETQLPITNSVQHNTFANYDFDTGQIISSTDQNGNVTAYSYDNMWRIKTITPPSVEGVTTFNYNDTVGSLSVEKTQEMDSTRSTDEVVTFDGLGRQMSQSTANDESTPWNKVDTCYDARGLKSFVSYPYQATGPSTARVCSGAGDAFSYDALSRTTSVAHSDGSSVTTSYTSAAISVLDEGNGTTREQRITQEDGLGRTISTCEVTSTTLIGITATPAACGQDINSTGFLTTYQYDALGNLAGTSQGGLNPRTFVYDSLSRLTTDTNPETGTTSYSYDADGNVYQRTRPAPNQTTGTVTTTYSYDALNRLTQTSYSDGTTPTVYDYYDESSDYGATLQNTIGRLSRTVVNTGTYAFTLDSYDAVGRVVSDWQNTPDFGGSSHLLSYSYDLAGDMTSASNGIGVTTSYTYNRATRITSATSSLSDGNHPGTLLSSLHYNAFGSPISASIGNGVSESYAYTPRGWVQSFTAAGPSTYSYSITNPSNGQTGYAPNGDLLYANDTVNGNCAYTYDAMNRLVSSNKAGQGFSYVYDRFGNRWQQNLTAGSGPTPNYSFDANNRIIGSGITYDDAGNVINDGTHTYTYDAENRIVKVDNGSTAIYAYDAEGRRIWKTSTFETKDYFYDLNGQLITELDQTGSWIRGQVYAGGKHLATYVNSTTYFAMGDWLGTERARSNVSGSIIETITSLPYGDGQTVSGICGTACPTHFTGKMRDVETGLDDFPARYYSSTQGRWYSPDWSPVPVAIPYANLANPQTLNLYDYVGGDPTNHADADGHEQAGVGSNQYDAVHKHAFGANDGQGQSRPVYCNAEVQKQIKSADMQAARDNGFSHEATTQSEKGFAANSTNGTAGPIQSGDKNGRLDIPTPPGTTDTFHTHSSGNGMPSTPNNNVSGSKDQGDTLKAATSHKSVYVISSHGLAVAPADGSQPHFVFSGNNFGEWFKAMQTSCNTPTQ